MRRMQRKENVCPLMLACSQLLIKWISLPPGPPLNTLNISKFEEKWEDFPLVLAETGGG